MQSAPALPHCAADVPPWQVPAESQQPKAQFVGVHFAAPQETPMAAAKPSTAPTVTHFTIVIMANPPGKRRST